MYGLPILAGLFLDLPTWPWSVGSAVWLTLIATFPLGFLWLARMVSDRSNAVFEEHELRASGEMPVAR